MNWQTDQSGNCETFNHEQTCIAAPRADDEKCVFVFMHIWVFQHDNRHPIFKGKQGPANDWKDAVYSQTCALVGCQGEDFLSQERGKIRIESDCLAPCRSRNGYFLTLSNTLPVLVCPLHVDFPEGQMGGGELTMLSAAALCPLPFASAVTLSANKRFVSSRQTKLLSWQTLYAIYVLQVLFGPCCKILAMQCLEVACQPPKLLDLHILSLIFWHFFLVNEPLTVSTQRGA